MATMHHRKTKRRRVQLAERDGGDRCFFCGDSFGATPTVDHLVPECRGGGHELGNLVLACAPCNRHKGARTVAEFEATRYLAVRRQIVVAQALKTYRCSHAAIRFVEVEPCDQS